MRASRLGIPHSGQSSAHLICFDIEVERRILGALGLCDGGLDAIHFEQRMLFDRVVVVFLRYFFFFSKSSDERCKDDVLATVAEKKLKGGNLMPYLYSKELPLISYYACTIPWVTTENVKEMLKMVQSAIKIYHLLFLEKVGPAFESVSLSASHGSKFSSLDTIKRPTSNINAPVFDPMYLLEQKGGPFCTAINRRW